MWLFWIALLGVVVWAVLRIVPSRGAARAEDAHGSGASPSREEPLEILDRRLASGELDVKAYEELRAKLTSHGSTGIG